MLGQLLAVCNLRSENVVSDAVWVGHSIVCLSCKIHGQWWLLPQQHGDYSYSNATMIDIKNRYHTSYSCNCQSLR